MPSTMKTMAPSIHTTVMLWGVVAPALAAQWLAVTATVINRHLKHIFCNGRHYTTPQIMMDRLVPT